MKPVNYLMLACLSFALLVSSCRKGDDNTVVTTATIKGTVKSENLNKVIGNALVYSDSKTSGHQTRTDHEGRFSLVIPTGHHTIYVETGDGSVFQTSFMVDVTTDQVFDVPEGDSRLHCKGSLAYIAGTFDHIEAVVHDTLGYAITQIQTSDLDNLGTVQTFDGIFLNCGVPSTISQQGYDNLGTFVAGGGSVYASDFGLDYIMGIYDGTCNPAGGFVDDSLLCVTRSGSTGTVPSANITDVNLQNAMGTTTVDLGFDLSGWNMVVNYSSNFWDVWVSAPATGPLLLHSNHLNNGGGAPGNIYWTAFHNGFNSGTGGANVSEGILEYVIMNI